MPISPQRAKSKAFVTWVNAAVELFLTSALISKSFSDQDQPSKYSFLDNEGLVVAFAGLSIMSVINILIHCKSDEATYSKTLGSMASAATLATAAAQSTQKAMLYPGFMFALAGAYGLRSVYHVVNGCTHAALRNEVVVHGSSTVAHLATAVAFVMFGVLGANATTQIEAAVVTTGAVTLLGLSVASAAAKFTVDEAERAQFPSLVSS